MYLRFPASGGFNSAIIESFWPTVKSKEVVLTVMLVTIGLELFTFTLTSSVSLSTVAFT